MNQIWQNMISRAYKLGLFDAVVTIGELKEHGSFGLGEYEALDGELIVWDGQFYRATDDGKLRIADDSDRLCFAQISDFHPQRTLEAPAGTTFDSIGPFLQATEEGIRNSFLALTIEGVFESVTATVYHPQTKPYPKAAAVTPEVFEFAQVKGRLIAFYSPPYMRDIGIPGYHFHFLDEGLTGGGHVTAFTLASGSIALEEIDRFRVDIPTNDVFRKVNLENT
jgi:acetolactate decarboxylase